MQFWPSHSCFSWSNCFSIDCLYHVGGPIWTFGFEIPEQTFESMSQPPHYFRLGMNSNLSKLVAFSTCITAEYQNVVTQNLLYYNIWLIFLTHSQVNFSGNNLVVPSTQRRSGALEHLREKTSSTTVIRTSPAFESQVQGSCDRNMILFENFWKKAWSMLCIRRYEFRITENKMRNCRKNWLINANLSTVLRIFESDNFCTLERIVTMSKFWRWFCMDNEEWIVIGGIATRC